MSRIDQLDNGNPEVRHVPVTLLAMGLALALQVGSAMFSLLAM